MLLPAHASSHVHAVTLRSNAYLGLSTLPLSRQSHVILHTMLSLISLELRVEYDPSGGFELTARTCGKQIRLWIRTSRWGLLRMATAWRVSTLSDSALDDEAER